MKNIRIGNGYDVHALADGLELWLGGVRIDSPAGCIAHSDGDVAIHALCDALLGALALGDIGKHFPDTSDEFKGIDSKILLKNNRPHKVTRLQSCKCRYYNSYAATETCSLHYTDEGNNGKNNGCFCRRCFRQSYNYRKIGFCRSRRRMRSICGRPFGKITRLLIE